MSREGDYETAVRPMLTLADLRERVGTAANPNQLIVPTEVQLDTDASPTKLLIEGFVLRPRDLECSPFELELSDGKEIVYVLKLVRDSHVALGSLMGGALDLSIAGMVGEQFAAEERQG